MNTLDVFYRREGVDFIGERAIGQTQYGCDESSSLVQDLVRYGGG